MSNQDIITKTGKHIDQIGWDKVLTQKEQGQIRNYLNSLDMADPQNRQMELIYDLMIHTGLRIAELGALRVRDCPGYLGVDAIFVFQGKGNKDRTIPIDPANLSPKLQEYIKTIRPKTIRRWARKDDRKPVFYNFEKRPYLQVRDIIDEETEKVIRREIRGSTMLYQAIRGIGEKAGIAKTLHPHMLRHTFAVNALRNGVDIYLLMTLMGHTRITMTARYLHLSGVLMEGLGKLLYRD